MVSHSIYACVAGTATQLAIATAMQSKKSAGAAYNNGPGTNISQVVVVPYSNQSITVLYDIPLPQSIGVQITITLSEPLPDPVNTVKDAIVNYALGLVDGYPGLVVGASVSPWEISAAVNAQYPQVVVTDLQIKNITAAGSYGYTTLPIAIYQQGVITTDTIAVVGP